MLTADIIDIKHLAVHDGPGIRTTFFFKGCPLRCLWCHNPESQSAQRELGFLENRCTGCRHCAEICSAHTFDAAGMHHIDRTQCRLCGRCVRECPMNALELYGSMLTLDDAVAAARRDLDFFRASGGGCTVSGGEPLLQSKFCAALFRELKRYDIHCAADTSGAVPWRAFEEVLPVTDLFLYDLKHPDGARHRELTGSGNAELLDRLRRLDRTGVPIEVRIPLVPGYNSTPEALAGFVKILTGLEHLTGVRILPFHRARFKYRALGRAEPLEALEPCPEELAAEMKKHFAKNHIKVIEN